MNNYNTQRTIDAVVKIANALTKLASEARRANDIKESQGR